MAWGNEQWSQWGCARGWYKGGEAVDGTASYLCQDIQLRHPAGAIVVGTVILMEPLNAGADDEVWRLEISLPGYSERWEYRRGWACITCTYIQGDDAGFAGHIKPSVPIDTVEAFAVYATEYLHALDPRVEYPAYRDIMRPQIVGRRASAPSSKLVYVVTGGNSFERTPDWREVLRLVAEWYDFLAEDPRFELIGGIPSIDPSIDNVAEGDLSAIGHLISEWENQIAEAAGYRPFYGHGSYAVSAASEMGLNLTVRAEEEEE